MSPEQRLDLIRRLSLASWTVKTPQHRSVGRREVEIIILVISAVVLIPWIAYLAVTLPHVYVTHNWDQAWVGFDILLLLLIVATAVLGIFRRQMVMLTAFATGVLLICDAWFDWMTSNRADVGWATVTALFFELPLAVLLITEACRLLRVVPARWGVVEARHAWNVRIPLATGPPPTPLSIMANPRTATTIPDTNGNQAIMVPLITGRRGGHCPGQSGWPNVQRPGLLSHPD